MVQSILVFKVNDLEPKGFNTSYVTTPIHSFEVHQLVAVNKHQNSLMSKSLSLELTRLIE